jgi:hypothetical protein
MKVAINKAKAKAKARMRAARQAVGGSTRY